MPRMNSLVTKPMKTVLPCPTAAHGDLTVCIDIYFIVSEPCSQLRCIQGLLVLHHLSSALLPRPWDSSWVLKYLTQIARVHSEQWEENNPLLNSSLFLLASAFLCSPPLPFACFVFPSEFAHSFCLFQESLKQRLCRVPINSYCGKLSPTAAWNRRFLALPEWLNWP